MLDAAQTAGILDRVVTEFVGHSAFRRSAGARRLCGRLVAFVVAEIERATAGPLVPARALPSTEGWLATLRDVVDGGLPDYESGDEQIAGIIARLTSRLDPDGRALLVELEAALNARNDRWAEDRFRLGVAVGRSGLADP